MSDNLSKKTEQMKEFINHKYGKEKEKIMSVCDNDYYSLVFSIVDNKIIIGCTNELGETSFKEIPFILKDD